MAKLNVVREGAILKVPHTSRETGEQKIVTVTFRDEAEAEAMLALSPFLHGPSNILKVQRRLDGSETGTSLQAELKRYRAKLNPVASSIVESVDMR